MAQRVSDDHVEGSDWGSGGWDEVAVARERQRWQRNEGGVIGGEEVTCKGEWNVSGTGVGR
jgi:hypothetical protein